MVDESRAKQQTALCLLQVLRGSSKFAYLSAEFLQRLSEVSIEHTFLPGDWIVKQGDKGDSMFILISGNASVHAGRGQLGVLGMGDIVGELAMLDVAPTRSASVKADAICTAWEIIDDDGLPIINDYPDAQKHFKELIVDHLERTV